MGGVEEQKKQHTRGKLTVRDRIDLLCDPHSFDEIGILTHHTSMHSDLKDRKTPADGVVCGFGYADKRPVAIIAYDFTVLAGSMGKNGETKVARLRAQAFERRIPLVWLLDSAGARVQEFTGSQFAGTGVLFRDQVLLSGVIPQVAAVMGPTAAGTSYIPALADFVPMVKGTGSMALAGPSLVKTAVGEEIDIESLGGSRVHTQLSGVGHLECSDDRSCIDAIRSYLSYFPSCYQASLPIGAPSNVENLNDEIFEILPSSARRAYDMKKVIRWLSQGVDFFEIQAGWAKNIVVGFTRLGGYPIGIVANQPEVLGGALDLDASDKATHFMNLCDAFGIPLLFLHDCPGFMVGSKMEHAGIIRHGAKMLYAVSRLTVPKFSVVVRKSYGAGYFVMCGRGFEPDLIVAWPGAEISLMSPEGAVNIITDASEDKKDRVEQYRHLVGGERSAEEACIDDVIDPRHTARLLFNQLKLLVPKHDHERSRLLTKKHGVSPV